MPFSGPTEEKYIRLLPTCEFLRILEFHGLNESKAMLLVYSSSIDRGLDQRLHYHISALRIIYSLRGKRYLPQIPTHQQGQVPIGQA